MVGNLTMFYDGDEELMRKKSDIGASVGTPPNDPEIPIRLATFDQYRSLLFSVAYRMLGSVADAEDMLQETFIRWQQATDEDIRSPRAFLVTIISRLCINHLESARVQREEYVGEWLPEPLVTDPGSDPLGIIRVDESLSMAFLVLLERLTPVERAVFLLREVFEYEYSEIAAVLGQGEWNRDGIIVFCPRPVGALHQIPAAGGTPEPVTLLDAARAEISHGFPQFLADGRRFLYFAASYRPGESSIRVGSLDSAVSKPLVGVETSAVYAPVFGGRSGCLLFVSHESLMAQPLDHQTLELRGEPEIVAQEVRYRQWGQVSVSVSSDGLLLYSRGTIDNYQFTWIDRQGMPVSTVGPSNGFASSPHCSFNLSPDERRVAIHRHDDPDTALATIWVMDLFRGGTLWRFTDPGGPEPEFCPVWSSSGVELLFSRGDDRGMRLLRRSLSGASAACIVDTKGPKFPTDWSGDGRFIAYNSQEPDYRYQHAWVASPFLADQPYPLLQHSHNNGSARFAPVLPEDGPHWIAYTSDETGRYEIYIRSFPDRGHKWQISNEGGFLPQWRRDGRELFYIALDGTLTAVAVNPEAFEFGRPQKLFVTGLHLHTYSIWMNQYGVANDGQKFLLNRRAEGSPVAITAVISR